MKPYKLQVPNDVERQIRQCRASIRTAIRKRLSDLVDAAAKRLAVPKKAPKSEGPPLRFYVFEGYRVTYQINAISQTIRVLGLHAETS